MQVQHDKEVDIIIGDGIQNSNYGKRRRKKNKKIKEKIGTRHGGDNNDTTMSDYSILQMVEKNAAREKDEEEKSQMGQRGDLSKSWGRRRMQRWIGLGRRI